MGRDLLAQDYLLKQVTASLIYPEDELGKKFWRRIYEEAQAKYGTTNIPVNTFNKVWIVPDKAVVYENSAKKGAAIDGGGHTAYVVESRLKGMLEADYLSLERNTVGAGPRPARSLSPGAGLEPARTDVNQLGSQIVREIVIPALTKEVNEGANFAQLRQVYNSLILATWYKKKIKDSILAKVYADRNKVAGVGYNHSVILSEAKDHKGPLDPSVATLLQDDTQKIYTQYLQAFKKGVYNYIKEDQDPITKQSMPRKYFSGGFALTNLSSNQAMITVQKMDAAQLGTPKDLALISVQVNPSEGKAITNSTAADKAMVTNPENPVKPVILDIPTRLNSRTDGTEGSIYLHPYKPDYLIKVFNRSSFIETYERPRHREAFKAIYRALKADPFLKDKIIDMEFIDVVLNGNSMWGIEIPWFKKGHRSYLLKMKEIAILDAIDRIVSDYFGTKTKLADRKGDNFFNLPGGKLINFDPFGYQYLIEEMTERKMEDVKQRLQRSSPSLAKLFDWVNNSEVYVAADNKLVEEGKPFSAATFIEYCFSDWRQGRLTLRTSHILAGIRSKFDMLGQESVSISIGYSYHESVNVILDEQDKQLLARKGASQKSLMEIIITKIKRIEDQEIEKESRSIKVPRNSSEDNKLDEAMLSDPILSQLWNLLKKRSSKSRKENSVGITIISDRTLQRLASMDSDNDRREVAEITIPRIVTKNNFSDVAGQLLNNFISPYGIELMQNDYSRVLVDESYDPVRARRLAREASIFALRMSQYALFRIRLADICRLNFYKKQESNEFSVFQKGLKERLEQEAELWLAAHPNRDDFSPTPDEIKFIEENQLGEVITPTEEPYALLLLLRRFVITSYVKSDKTYKGKIKSITDLRSWVYETIRSVIPFENLNFQTKEILFFNRDRSSLNKDPNPTLMKIDRDLLAGTPGLRTKVEGMSILEYARWLSNPTHAALIFPGRSFGDLTVDDMYLQIFHRPTLRGWDGTTTPEGSEIALAHRQALLESLRNEPRFYNKKSKDDENNFMGIAFGKYNSEWPADGVQYKGYITFKNWQNEFTPAKLKIFNDTIRAKGLRGILKILSPVPEHMWAVLLRAEDIVIYSDDDQSVLKALEIAKEIFGQNSVLTSTGIDLEGERSFYRMIAKTVLTSLQSEEPDQQIQIGNLPSRITTPERLRFLQVDWAMGNQPISPSVRAKGGIDFNPNTMNLQTQNQCGEIKFNMDPALLEQLQNAPGFTPVIISIQPMTDLRLFLGLKENSDRHYFSINFPMTNPSFAITIA